MKKSDLLKQQRAALETELNELLKVAERNDDQNRSFDDLDGKITTIDLLIAREERIEKRLLEGAAGAGRSISSKEEKEISNYSFSRAIGLLASGNKVDGFEAEMDQEGKREFAVIGKSATGFAVPMLVLNQRASTGQNVTTAADGGNLVQTDQFIFIESLKNALVLTQLGAKFLTGLVGNLPLVRGGSFTPSWVAEGSAVSFTKEAFSKATMTPKNLMIAGALSKMLLNQTNGAAEMLIRDELIKAIVLGIEAAAINGPGTAAPTGILGTSGIGSVAGGTDGAAPTWGNIVDLEGKILAANASGNISYLSNNKVAAKLKQTLKASNVSGYILENGITNGAKFLTTNAVPSNLDKGSGTGVGVCSAIIAGDFRELFIGLWGGLDITVDGITRADYNEVKLVINQFADVALRNASSFAAMKDALTA